MSLEAGIEQESSKMLNGKCQRNNMYRYIAFIEEKFQNHGERVARNPRMTILLAFLSVLAMMAGFLSFRQERNPLHLWIPEDSHFYTDTNWLMGEYGEGLRLQTVLITAPDVLQPDLMLQLLQIHEKVVNSSGPTTVWQDICFKVPIISFNVEESRFRREVPGSSLSDENSPFTGAFFEEGLSKVTQDKSGPSNIQQMMTDETFDPSILLGTTLYCSIVRNMELGCLQQNLLDLWKYNETKIKQLTKPKIIHDLNSTVFSPTLGHPISFKTLLGGITYDDNGIIISAKALMTLYAVHVNFSTVNMDEVGNQGGTADWANGPGLEWESYFLNVMHEAAQTITGMEVFYEAGRSFGDISASGMFQDMDKIIIGVGLMLIYIQIQQSQKSWVETRIIPSMVGLMCVGLAFLSACGLCSLMGIPYGPVHTSLPFLLLGIGVDDMFVILNCWNSLPTPDKILPIPQRMGVAMRHAGLSISITSVTDFVAFMIGSTTILPSLRSFCLYAGVGVFITFILQSTLFVAALALDQTRMQAGRNCLVPCVRHTPPKLIDVDYFSQCSYGLTFIYSKFIMTKFGKVLVILVTFMLVGGSCVGTSRIKQEFKPEWFLDHESHLYKFLEKRNEFFPEFGNSAGIYMGKLHYNEELQNIGLLVQQLKNRSDIVMNVEDWWSGFHRYVKFHFSKDIEHEILLDSDFNHYISQYLFSPSGARFQKNFRFTYPLECGKPASYITVASIDFFFRKFESSDQSVPAMNAVKNLVMNANFTTGDRFATVWAKVFANWVTDEVIAFELVRNIVLAIIVVAITTFILLGSIYASTLVLLCVILTLVNTVGFMYYWGLTIDLVSSIALVLAVGLCVDFAAHIAYAFMGVKGSQDERAKFAVSYIGGAVLHGGATTLLALSVLVFSNSYIFTAFFKIFLLVIFMGLFHGIVFLPVVLSLIGPKPYPNAKQLQPKVIDQALEPVNEGL